MALNTLDWLWIGGYLAAIIGLGLWFRRRASQGIKAFFAGGQSLPWWIAGTSMVATTFAADTPLAVTSLVAEHGIAGNWVWWSFAVGGMLTTFVFAGMWRRSGVLTDVEFVRIRYAGKAATFLRRFRAVYVAGLINAMIIGWVTKAMLTVLQQTVLYGTDAGNHYDLWIVGGLLCATVLYSALSGLFGVVFADALQFVLAMAGSIALAVFAMDAVGGSDGLREKLATVQGGKEALNILPEWTDGWMPMQIFLLYLGVQWWATWYPGAEPGGGGYVVQRMAACKDARHATLATLWYQLAHYVLRPWPWILVALAAIALHPELRTYAIDEDPATDAGAGYPMMIRELAPPGLRGLLLVAFGAAYMSTISTQLNWGASYLVNDLWRPWQESRTGKAPSARQETRAARGATLCVLLSGLIASVLMIEVSVDRAWKLMIAVGAGTGVVFMARWFWWRINAWSEIAAMGSSLALWLTIRGLAALEVMNLRVEVEAALIAGGTLLVWVPVTLLTKPEKPELLDAFFRRVRPSGPGWKPVALRGPVLPAGPSLGYGLLATAAGGVLVYGLLAVLGAVFLGPTEALAPRVLTSIAACAVMLFAVRKGQLIER